MHVWSQSNKPNELNRINGTSVTFFKGRGLGECLQVVKFDAAIDDIIQQTASSSVRECGSHSFEQFNVYFDSGSNFAFSALLAS